LAIVRVHETLHTRFVDFFSPLLSDGAMPAGWSLFDIETEQGISLVFSGPQGTLTVELDRRDPARPCFTSTGHFNIYYSILDRMERHSQALRPDEMELMERVVSCVRAREGDLVLTDAIASSARVHVRELQVDRVLVPEAERVYYMNPYVGCMIGCPFCYAGHRGDLSRWLEGLPKARWGQWADVKINAAEVLRRECRDVEPGIVRMSPIITDPYQPIERKYQITRQSLQVLLEEGFIPVILTRSSLVARDIDLLAQFEQAAVGFSIPSDDDRIRALVEPGAEPIAARIETLRRLQDAGVSTFAMLQPMLPLDKRGYLDLVAPLVKAIYIRPTVPAPELLVALRSVDRPGPLTPGWELETFKQLMVAFETRGVQVNPENDPWSFLG